MKTAFLSVIAGLGLIISQSAFTTAVVPNYGKDASNNWISLSGLTPVSPTTPPEAGEYRCINDEDICTARFDYANPANNATDYVSGSETPGQFDLGQ